MAHPYAPSKSPALTWPARLDWLAFGLLLALVFARCTMQEHLREPFLVVPHSEATPRTPGPATSIALDLLCCLPALLVLCRRCIDPKLVLAFPRSLIALGLLDIWMLASTCWASDRFAALVNACHWIAAGAVLWAALHLVRDWVRLRLLTAVLVGLLAALVVQGFEFRFVEWPTTLETFEKHKTEMLQGASIQPGTYEAIQFEKKLKLGELFGFFESPNTFGGVVSLLLVLTLGQLLQLISDRSKRSWSITTLGIVLAVGLVILGLTRSRGAMTTFCLAGVAFAMIAKFRMALAPSSNRNYWIGVLIMLLGVAAVIGHGLYHHRLPTSTLTFRWQYWVGSAGVLREHPLLGVGWSNFGLSYLAHRLPQAPEEIKDPHNFFVRFFAELGIVGGLLVIAWQLRLWWELTRPRSPSPIESPTGPGTINFLATVIGAATAIWLLVDVDLAREPFETYLVRLVFFGAAVVASSLAALRAIHSQELDGSSAPWILLAVILAIGGMFLHNLIDFSMFEIGPMMLLFLLIGAMLGLRQPAVVSHRPGGKAALAIASLIWLAGLLAIWAPIMNAEQDASEADDAVRAARFSDAEKLYAQANTTLHGLNGDYIYRAAVVSPPEEGPARLQLAIDENPKNAVYRFDAARAQMLRLNPDVSTIRRDFDAGLALDPNNVAARLEYAKWLARIGDADAAHREFQRAVDFNNLLNPDENKRLTPEQLDKERQQINLSLKR